MREREKSGNRGERRHYEDGARQRGGMKIDVKFGIYHRHAIERCAADYDANAAQDYRCIRRLT
jgi:hypothetical protein